MRILLTNDDGIQSDGLVALIDALNGLRDARGEPLYEVWTVAPEHERSGVRSCDDFKKTHENQKIGRFPLQLFTVHRPTVSLWQATQYSARCLIW